MLSVSNDKGKWTLGDPHVQLPLFHVRMEIMVPSFCRPCIYHHPWCTTTCRARMLIFSMHSMCVRGKSSNIYAEIKVK